MGDHAALAQLGLRTLTNEHNLPWSYFVGAAGMTGQTAYYGLKRISDPKAVRFRVTSVLMAMHLYITQGETIYISAAAGAVGQ